MSVKKIPVSQLEPGMFIHDLNCGWMDHPFLITRFKLGSERDLQKIHAAGIREVYIDTRLGRDVADAPTHQDVGHQIDAEIDAQVRPSTARPVEARASLQEELARAHKIHGEANRLMRSMMSDVRLGKQVEVEQIAPMVDKMAGSILRNNGALLSLNRIKNKDEYTFQHSVSVATLLMAFAHALQLDEDTLHQAGIGGMVHDVGKMQTPDAILNKPGKLSDEEFVVMRHHVVASREILEVTPNISTTALEVAAQHHERFDGSGYPHHLQGEAISRMGQMAAIVDVYDAITSDRVYHKGMSPTDALRKLVEWSKFHFNPALVHAFVRMVGIYPVGTLVRLESERLAVVIEQRETNMLQPLVRVLFSIRGNHYLRPEDLDLSRPLGSGGGDRILAHESPKKWQIELARFL